MKSVFKFKLASTLFVAFSAAAATQPLDVRSLHPMEKNINNLPAKYVFSAQHQVKSTLKFAPVSSLEPVELVVFYQPSYAATFGDYSVNTRIPKFINTLNEAIANHGLSDYKVVIKDIVSVKSVPDDAPYLDVVDDNGNVIQDGADYLFSVAVLNESSLVDGEWIDNPEYEVFQKKWNADLALYVREKRANDGLYLGFAGIGGELSSILDDGSDADKYTTAAHEIGHNFGMNHEEGQASVGPEYARAWECGGKKTIMYSKSTPDNTVRHFSDPNLQNNNEACGDESVANNIQVLTENFSKTAARRQSVAPAGAVDFKKSDYEGNESDGVAFVLTRNGDLSVAASVKVFAKNDEAIWGEDFVDTFVLAEFEPGEAETTVIYPFIDDGMVEGAETFSVYLQYPYKLSLGESTTANAIVYDGDKNGAGGMVTIDGPLEILEGQSGVFTISRNGGVGEIIVNVSAKSDDAVVGVDYVALNETLVFKAGEFEKTVELVLPNNDIPEPTKSVDITISSPNSSVTYSNAVFKVSLLDDEVKTAGSFSFASNGTTISEALGSIKVKVVREGGFIPTNINVIASVNGVEHVTAAAFSDNELEKTVTVDIPANSNGTGDYDLVLTLQSDDASAVVSESTLTYKITRAEPNKPNPTGDGDSGGGSTGFGFLSLAGLLLFRRLFK